MKKIWIAKIKLAYENLLCLVSRDAQIRREVRKKVTDDLCDDYRDLIIEYGLIQEKKSKMSRSERNKTVKMIHKLIEKGHIKVNQ